MLVMNESLLFIKSLLIHIEQIQKMLGNRWPVFCRQLVLSLQSLSLAENNEQVLQAVDNIISVGLNSEATDLFRTLLNEVIVNVDEIRDIEKDSSENHNLEPAQFLPRLADVITAGQELAGKLSSMNSTDEPTTSNETTTITSSSYMEASPNQREKLLVRHTDISCPRRIWIETPRISVVVRLTIPMPIHSANIKDLTFQEDLPLLIRIEAPGFKIINDQEQMVTVSSDADSQPIVFDLSPLEIGSTHITFDFFQNGNPISTVSIPVEVTASEVSVREPSVQKQSLTIETNVQPPDLMLYVSYEYRSQQPALIFTLFRVGEAGRTFYPVKLYDNPQAKALQFYDQLATLTEQFDPTIKSVFGKQTVLPPEDIDWKLKQFGQNLWRNLIPEDLKILYEQEREKWQNKTLMLVSDEPYIPWELIWPYGQGWEDNSPWCVTLCFTRWLRRDTNGNGHEAPSIRLPFKSFAYLIPTDSNLFGAQQEHQFLKELLVKHNLANVSPATPEWPLVRELLEKVSYNWLHIATHGNFYPDAPDADSAVWLQNQRPLTPDAFVGPSIEDYIRKHRPGFVFNTCHSGREGWSLTRLGGWANRLISTGAGLFLGSLWTVEDHAALEFASTFYQKLLDGETVAEATRHGRLASKRPGNPTWLAYSVYAHPNARVFL